VYGGEPKLRKSKKIKMCAGTVGGRPFALRGIMVHTFTINGVHIALDVYSGAVHMLDDAAFAALVDPSGAHDLGVVAEIDALTREGQLFTPLTDERREQEAAFNRDREPVVKALCLHIAHNCNLRCAYCFAGEGDYKSKKALMSLDVGMRAIDFLIKHSGGRRNLEVDFFGGEPTLNFEVVKGIVAYARGREAEAGKRFRFTLTTNGLLLDDEKIDYINAHMDNVVLSLDGRKNVHDRMRKRRDGRGCYDAALANAQKLVARRGQERYYIRGTYTRENMDFGADVLHLADLGFTQVSVEPVVAPADAPLSIRPEDVPALCAEYERLVIEMAARGFDFNFFHFMLDEGDLYPCHQFVGDEDFCLGSLDKGVTNAKWQEQFNKCNIHTKPECEACFAKYFCSGGCAANAFHLNKDIMKPDEIGCEMQRKRLECALFLLAAN
jgi:uncharacterized protein